MAIAIDWDAYSLISHNSNKQIIILTVQSWYDEFLSWDEEKYGGLHEVLVEKDEVWIPDLLVGNT